MADIKISALTNKPVPGSGDLFPLVDVTDTTMASTGTDKNITYAQLIALVQTITEASITGTTTLTTAAYGKVQVCSGTAANYTVTLPSAVGYAGQTIGFRMSGALTRLVTIATSAGQTIDGAATRVMWAGEVAILECDGSNWFKVGGRTLPMTVKMRRSSNQSIASGSDVKVILDQTDSDNTGMMADPATNHRITVLRNGLYTVYGQLFFNGLSANEVNLGVKVYMNGVDLFDTNVAGLSGGYLSAPIADNDIPLSAGDHIELYTQTGSAEVIYGSATGPCSFFGLREVISW